MTILVLISLALAVVGVVLMSRGGIPESVSGMVFGLPVHKRWVWSAWLVAVALTVMVPLMTALGDAAWLGWLTVVGLAGAAVTPICNGDTKLLHDVFGVSAGVLSQVCVAVLCPWWLLVWLLWLPLLAGAMAAMNDAKDTPRLLEGYGVLAAEVTCAVTLYGCLIFN